MNRMGLCFLLIACKGDAEKEGSLEAMLTGSIYQEDFEISAEFTGYKAFAFDDQGTFLAYISSNPEANCSSVSEYLNIEANTANQATAFDPNLVLLPEYCNLFIKLDDFEGSFFAEDDNVATAASSMECPMGPGSFDWTVQGSDSGYYYSGKWFTGVPRTYTWDISGSHAEGYTLDIEMSTYDGNFTQDLDAETRRYDATGDVSGRVSAFTCNELATTGFF